MLFDAIKKCLGKFDYVILLIAVYMFTHFDYANLDIVQIVYIVSFVLWLAMLCFRIYITCTGREPKKLK